MATHPHSGGPKRGNFFSEFVDGRRGQILDAALTVFGEKGYEAGTMREIASLVGVTEPALYRHYSGKEALLVDLIQTAGEHLAVSAAEQLERIGSADPAEALLVLMRDRRDLVNSNVLLMRTLILAAHQNAAAREVFRTVIKQPMRDVLRGLVRRVDAARGIQRPPAELESRVRAMMSTTIGYFLTSKFFDEEPDDRAMVDALMAMMGW